MVRVHAGTAGSSGGRTVLALMRTLLASCSIDEESATAGAGQGGVVKDSSSHAGGALRGVEGVADRTVEG